MFNLAVQRSINSNFIIEYLSVIAYKHFHIFQNSFQTFSNSTKMKSCELLLSILSLVKDLGWAIKGGGCVPSKLRQKFIYLQRKIYTTLKNVSHNNS